MMAEPATVENINGSLPGPTCAYGRTFGVEWRGCHRDGTVPLVVRDQADALLCEEHHAMVEHDRPHFKVVTHLATAGADAVRVMPQRDSDGT